MVDQRNLTGNLPLLLLVFILYINAEVPVRKGNTDRLDAIAVDYNPGGANACRDYTFYDLGIWTMPSNNNHVAVSFLDRPLRLQTITYSWNGNNFIETISSKQSSVIPLINYEKNISINRFR